jgi:hypothetical protein
MPLMMRDDRIVRKGSNMPWRHPFEVLLEERRLPGGEVPPELDALYRDYIAHLLLERRLARLSKEEQDTGLAAVEDLLPVLPPRTVKILEELLGPRKAPQDDRLAGLSAAERLEGLSAEEIIEALPPETLAALRRQLKGKGSLASPSGKQRGRKDPP